MFSSCFLLSFAPDIGTSHKNCTKIVLKLYFLKEKRLLIVFLVMVQSIPLFSQEGISAVDTTLASRDTLVFDSDTISLKGISPDAIDKQVTYTSRGMKKNDLVNKTSTLVDGAVVKYGEIEIAADSIVFNMQNNTVFATGRRDSTGKLAGTPVFKDGGSQEIASDSLFYNFVTRKAIAYEIVTKQEEGLLRSDVTKLLEDGTSNIARSTYSTCDAEEPHFYIRLPKAKIYPGKKIISGPGYLVLEGIPLPVALPFGFFPIQTKKAASGILIPKVGQEQQRGYNLTDGGYYFAINDHFDLALKGSIYTNGTWIITAETDYNKIYKYSGSLSFSYANNISGHKGLPDYSKITNYKLGWTYTQHAKARPGSRFSANVNMSSSGYDKTNSYQVMEHVSTQRQSSVSYSKTWEGTPFNLSTSMNHNQDIRTKKVNLNLPKVNFNVGRIYPLKGRSAGTKKWYQELQFQYSASIDNQISTYDSLLFTNKLWNSMRSGFKHEAPLSLQIRPFRNFSISPQVSYSGVLFTQKFDKQWKTDYFDEETGEYVSKIITDTTRGVFYGHAINPSIGASFNPQVYGTYDFKSPKSRIQSVRHVMKPSVSFSYTPSLKGLSTDFYRTVQYDTLGHTRDYSIFEGNIYGTPSSPNRSGRVSFNLGNIIEAKVFDRNDTTGKPKKVKIIDNLGINTSYDLFADSMKWSPVTMSMNTNLLDNIGISARSSFSLYGLNDKGRMVSDFALEENRKLMRLTNFNVSLDFDLASLIRGDKGRESQGTPRQGTGQTTPGLGQEGPAGVRPGSAAENAIFDEYGYAVFDVPWSMRVSYNLNYSKPELVSRVTQTLSLSGNVKLTKKMDVTYTSGFDFTQNEITMTQIGITRDLHCWDMSFNWIPNGTMKMWNFTIRVKAAVLSDLKYEQRKDYHDDLY